VESAATEARSQSLILQSLSGEVRSAILLEIADSLQRNKQEILKVNALDIEAAKMMQMSKSMRKRLVLSNDKLKSLSDGIKQIAHAKDPIGDVIARREIAAGLMLEQKTVPIGVLLIIFESRPDCLPQIASLAIKSGNGLLLKGGKEAKNSNRFLHKLIHDAIVKGSQGKVRGEVVSLIETRQDIAKILTLESHIDLIIPRGSYGLVNYIKNNTKIPVLGHADGICHVYVDREFQLEMVIRLILDAKLNYPAACNAAETLLLHGDVFAGGKAQTIIQALQKGGIEFYASKEALEALSGSVAELKQLEGQDFSNEYGDHRMTLHIVKDVLDAVDHINTHGSGHTDTIVTTDTNNAKVFMARVASACVFHNASTRFADGFRLGLGAEVGISTGKIHARGPVGVKGLTTTQWTLTSQLAEGHTVTDFADGKCSYTHKELKLTED